MTTADTPAGVEGGKLRLRGDWGAYNLTRACGWLANWMWKQTPDHRLSVIHTGRGMGDNLRALARGEVDVAISTPGAFAKLALEGIGPFADGPMPELRAIASLPHRDAMLFAAPETLGIGSLAQLRTERRPIRLSIGAADQDGFMGFGAGLVLESAGISLRDIEDWGGSISYHEDPFGCLSDLASGAADAVIAEAVMTPQWSDLADQVRLRFVSLDEDEVESLSAQWKLGTITLPAGYLTGMSAAVRTLDFSDWLVVTTTALPDEDAACLARAVMEDANTLELQFRHLPSERSPLTYPITVEHASTTSIPLHPGAQSAYETGTHVLERTASS